MKMKHCLSRICRFLVLALAVSMVAACAAKDPDSKVEVRGQYGVTFGYSD